MIGRDEILRRLTPQICETLGVEPDEVLPSARLFEDLGAESVDILDLSFRCEKEFGVPVRLHFTAGTTAPETDSAGRLTPAALTDLKTRFPFLSTAAFEADPKLTRITELLTVDAVVGAIEQTLSGGQPSSPPLAAR